MAFLTKYNLSQLSQKLEINCEVTLPMFLEHIYNDEEIFSILNKREILYLFKYKMLLDDEDKFAVEYYNNVPEKEDTKDYVFNKGGKMKYHLTSDCKLISKDYLDFSIPEEIRKIGNVAVAEYRNWFNQNKYGDKFRAKTIDTNTIISAFNSKYPSKYNFSPIEENSNLLVIEQPNSTHDKVSFEYDKEATFAELNELKLKWQTHFPCRVTKTMAKFKHLLSKSDDEIQKKISELFSEIFISNYGMENLKKRFKISKDITNRIISLILEHIKWTYNLKDKDFNNKTLETFGLECCLNCLKENKSNS